MSIEKCFTQAVGNKPVSIRSNSNSELVIEIPRESKSNVLPTIPELIFSEYQEVFEVKIVPSHKRNQSKCLIYIQEHNQRNSQNTENY